MATSTMPSFFDNFSSLSLHPTWQPGDKWALIAPGTPLGRGGHNYNEFGDQWWTDPYNANTPISDLYGLAPGGGLQLGLLPTPPADQGYINAQAGASLPFVGALMNTYNSNYQKYGLWDITAAVPATPGASFEADIENVQITGTWPPAIWLRISTDSTGAETVLYDVATTSGILGWTTSSKAGFDATRSHTYGWDWESDNITFFIDGKQVWQVATPQDGSYTTNPMFLYLFTGANYVANGDPKAASLPFQVTIANVSVYPSLTTPTPPTVTAGSGPDQLVLKMSGDAYANGDGTSDAAGDPSFTVSVDGKQVGGTFTTVVSHSAGQSQSFLLNGAFGTGQHTVAVTFLNDAWGGSSSTDRNLYVNDVVYMGADTLQSAGLYTAGTKSFTVTGGTPIPPTVTAGSGPDQLVLRMSGDAYANGDGTSDAAGDPSFAVSVDGKQVGGTFTTVASHSAGQSQSFLLNGTFGTGQHTVAVTFLNDAWYGSSSTDRNLYVNDVLYAGADTLQLAGLYTDGNKSFTVTGGTASAAVSSAAIALSAPLASAASVSATPSPDDTVVTSGGSQPITDSRGNLWTIVNGHVAVNGAVDAATSNVVKLAFVQGRIWDETGSNVWQYKAAPTASWVPAGGTTIPPISVGISANQQNQLVDATAAHAVSDAGATIDIIAPGVAAATLGAGSASMRFAAMLTVNVTGGSGAAQVTLDGGTLNLDAGTGKLTVAGGPGPDAYAYHAGSGGLTISDFIVNQGDVLKIDSALQGAMKTIADGSGGTMLTFGSSAGSIDLRGLAALPSNAVRWV